MISGTTSNSRLTELKKYKITNIFAEKYIGGGTFISNGVDFNDSIENELVIYYIDGLKYIDNIENQITTYFFESQGIDDINFINKPLLKTTGKIVSNPKIHNDVFIIRQEFAVFEKNYRLEHIKNLNELLTYVGGNFFKVFNNT